MFVILSEGFYWQASPVQLPAQNLAVPELKVTKTLMSLRPPVFPTGRIS